VKFGPEPSKGITGQKTCAKIERGWDGKQRRRLTRRPEDRKAGSAETKILPDRKNGASKGRRWFVRKTEPDAGKGIITRGTNQDAKRVHLKLWKRSALPRRRGSRKGIWGLKNTPVAIKFPGEEKGFSSSTRKHPPPWLYGKNLLGRAKKRNQMDKGKSTEVETSADELRAAIAMRKKKKE